MHVDHGLWEVQIASFLHHLLAAFGACRTIFPTEFSHHCKVQTSKRFYKQLPGPSKQSYTWVIAIQNSSVTSNSPRVQPPSKARFNQIRCCNPEWYAKVVYQPLLFEWWIENPRECFWVNYNDLTRPNSPQMVVYVGNSPQPPYFRLVK